MPNARRQMLDQRSAAGDVQNLHAAADSKEREVALDRALRQGDLELVALADTMLSLRGALRPIENGVDVGAASEQQRVEKVEHEIRFARLRAGRAGA